MPFLPRIPLPLLPLCIRGVRKVSGALLVAHDALERLRGDLREMHVGKHGSMCRRCCVAVPCGDDICDDCIPAFCRKVTRRCNCVRNLPAGQCGWCDPERVS